MLSVYWQVPRQQAEPDSCTAVEEENCACGTLGVASKKPILSPKDKNRGKKRVTRRVCGGMQDALRTFRKVSLQLEHSGPSLRSWELFTSHTQTLCEGGPAAPLRDAPLQLRAAMARCRLVEEGPTNLLRKGALCHTAVFPKKTNNKKKNENMSSSWCGRKGSAESRCICVRLTDPPSAVPLEARVVTHTCQLCPRSIFFMEVRGIPIMTRLSTLPRSLHTCAVCYRLFSNTFLYEEREILCEWHDN